MDQEFINEPVNWNQFYNWFTQFNNDTFPLEYSEFEVTGRGMKATQDIKNGDPIVRIPKQLLINYETIVMNELNGKTNPLTSHQLISLYLIIQVHLKELSEWKFYLNSLPKQFPIHDYLIDHFDDMKPLLPLDLIEQFEKIFNRLTTDYNQVEEFIKSNTEIIPKLFKNESHLINQFQLNFKEFQWSWLIVNTRCIYLNGYKFPLSMRSKELMTLAPGLDLLNHHSQSKISTKFNYSKNSLEIINLSETYTQGEEVFINYGLHDNNFLLVEYGFLLPDNPFDYWKLDHYIIDEIHLIIDIQSKEYQQKIEFLTRLNLTNEFYLNLQGEMDFKLLNYLRYLLLPNQENNYIFLKIWNGELDKFEGNLNFIECQLNEFILSLLNNLLKLIDYNLSIINQKLLELGNDQNSNYSILLNSLNVLWSGRKSMVLLGIEEYKS